MKDDLARLIWHQSSQVVDYRWVTWDSNEFSPVRDDQPGLILRMLINVLHSISRLMGV